jgi:hypothetical protein
MPRVTTGDICGMMYKLAFTLQLGSAGEIDRKAAGILIGTSIVLGPLIW